MPQGQGYGNQKRQTFNYTSAFQNALSTGATAATIHPYLALPGAAAGFYFGGKSGPFQPSSMDYKPFRDAYEKYENSALKNLRQGVNAIGSQSSQRAASQGLYGSPLGQSIIQNNQNYALNSGLGNINNNRYQFEAGLAQNQFNAQQSYDQQIGQQSIGTLTNLLASAPGIIESVKGLQNGYISRPVSQRDAERQQLPQRFDRLENGQGAPQQQPTPSALPPPSSLQAYDQQMRKRSIGTGTSEFPDQLSVTPQQQPTPLAPPQARSGAPPISPFSPPGTSLPEANIPQAPPKTELEQYGRIVSSELVDEINSMFGDIFDFDSPLAPLGSAIDSAIENQGQGQQPTPESTIRQGTIPGGAPDPNAPPAAPPQNWFPGQRPITTATSNADIRSRTIPGGDVDPNTPLPNPNIPYDPIRGVPQNWGDWRDYIDRKHGTTPRLPTIPEAETPQQPTPLAPPQAPISPFSPPGTSLPEATTSTDNSSAIDMARELIIFGETDTSRRYASKPIVDPASGGGYNIGWGRNITHNGLDVQNELIPMLRGGHEVTDNYLQTKLSVAGISMTQEGKVRLTPRQVNRLFPNGINNQMADMLRENDIKSIIPEITQTLGGNVFNTLTPARQAVLMDMFYTLGKSRFGKFRKMIDELRVGNYAVAAAEMRNSAWYFQVGTRRATPLMAKMIAGE